MIDCFGCGNYVNINIFQQDAKLNVKKYEHSNFNAPSFSVKSSSSSLSSSNSETFKSQSSESTKSNKYNYDTNFNRPYLKVCFKPNIMKTVRRRALDCSGESRGQCCKQSFYVSFKALGWDSWIIAPPGYFANYCRGDCNDFHRTPDTYLTYYAYIIDEYRVLDKIQPCCTPIKFSSMSLIYYGPNQNIIKRDLPKMVVDECGCP